MAQGASAQLRKGTYHLGLVWWHQGLSCCLCHCCQVSTSLLQKQLPANMSGEVGKQKIIQVGVGLAQPELVVAIWGVKHRWRSFFSVPPYYHHPVTWSLKQTLFKGGGGGKRGWGEHFSQAFYSYPWLLSARTMHLGSYWLKWCAEPCIFPSKIKLVRLKIHTHICKTRQWQGPLLQND